MSQCKVIAVANQKGGGGNTSTTFSLGVALAKYGKRVLLVGANPQWSLTIYMACLIKKLINVTKILTKLKLEWYIIFNKY